jgi:exopolysaccharide biosynthesis polyprenyl glycosylphosphotransferase
MATVSLDSLSKHKPLPGKINGQSAARGRSTSRPTLTTFLMMATDVLCVMIALTISVNLGLERFLGPAAGMRAAMSAVMPLSWQLGYLACFLVALLTVSHHQGLYGHTLMYSGLYEQRRCVQSGLIAGLLLCGAMYVMNNAAAPRSVVVYLICLTIVFCCISRACWRYLMFRRYERGLNSRNVVILGATGIGMALYRQISSNRHLGRVFKGFVQLSDNNRESVSPEMCLGALDQLRYLARQHFIDELIIAESCSMAIVRDLVDIARDAGMEILVVPGFYDGITPEAPMEYLGDFPVVSIHRRDEKVVAVFMKRVLDVILSTVALLVSLPLIIVIAAAIKYESNGPAFYVSDRVGRKGRIFRCFKFRTMVVGADKLKDSLKTQNERVGILFKMKNDPRVTRVGKFLRKYSLDEIPQFLNVLRGEMSMVGPRPPIASEVEKYASEHFRRLEVPPGLTGLWQVRARQDPSFERYVALDLAYVENWSLWLDLKIMVRTADAVLRGTGA